MFCRNLFVIACFLLFATQLMADDSQRHAQAGGMDLYLGVVPAQLTLDYPMMHGDVSSEEHRYHLLIALFDSKSGRRITEAVVKATVSPLGQEGKTMTLEPMPGDAVTFGNYFTLNQPEHYRIKIEVQRDRDSSATVANFIYQRSQD